MASHYSFSQVTPQIEKLADMCDRKLVMSDGLIINQ